MRWWPLVWRRTMETRIAFERAVADHHREMREWWRSEVADAHARIAAAREERDAARADARQAGIDLAIVKDQRDFARAAMPKRGPRGRFVGRGA